MIARLVILSCLGPLIFSSVAQTPAEAEPDQPKLSDSVQRLFDEVNKFARGGDYEGALKTIDRALALAEGAHDAVGEVRVHRGRAINLTSLKRIDEAVAEWRAAATGWERLGDGPGRIEALGVAGQLLLANNPTEAKALLEQALSLSGEEKRRPLAAAHAVLSVGVLTFQGGDLEWAKRIFLKLLENARGSESDSLDVATALMYLGDMAREQADLKTAKEFYQQMLAIREKLAPDSLDVAASLTELGNVAQEQGDLEAAKDYHQQALAIMQKLAPGSLYVAASLNNLGIVADEQGDLKAAKEYQQKALAIWEKLAPGSLYVAKSLNNLGNVANEQGDLKAAKEYHQQALAIREKLAPGSLDVAMSLKNLGSVAQEQGDLKTAKEFYQQALAIEQKPLDVAASLNNLGSVANEQGDLKAAKEYHQQALAIREKLAPGSLDVAQSLNNLGIVAYEQGDLKAAKEYHQQALAIREKLAPGSLYVAGSLNNLGIVAQEQGDLKAANEYYQVALAIEEKRAPDSLTVPLILKNLALVSRDSGQLDSAETLAARGWRMVQRQAEALTSDETRQAFGSAKHDYVQVLMDIQLARGESDAALVTLEEGRAQALARLLFERREVLGLAIGDLWPRHQQALADLHQAEEALSKLERMPGRGVEVEERTNNARKEYQKARKEIDQLWVEIQKREPRAFAPRLELAEARKALGATGTFVAFASDGGEAYSFALGGGKSTGVLGMKLQLSPAPDFNSRIVGFWQRLRTPPPSGAETAKRAERELLTEGRDLFDLLFPGEIGELVRKSKRLMISPDGPLWQLPFAALVTHVDPDGTPHYLGEQAAITYTPSLSLYVQLKKEMPQLKPGQTAIALVVGDPNFNRKVEPDPKHPDAWRVWAELYPQGSTPRRLEATAKESAVIARLYGSDPLTGDNATESEVRKRIDRADVIHFATHGALLTASPMSSGLALTPPRRQPGIGETNNDGALQAWEIFSQLKLRAELVVLSACDTGRGDLVRGEGIVGLTRALQYAGARSIVATQWSVDAGESTSNLMEEFHRNLRKGKPKDEALKEAMGIVRMAHPHPFFWAPFILLGDPDNPNLGVN